MASAKDLSLAYSPGVAAACEEIARDPQKAWEYTTRGNMVAVITNGTAVLGLGNIGPLASKPVMEGKAVLFKKFAGIDSIDIEVDALDPEKFIEVVAALEPSFGAINLEDIRAPECFEIERRLPGADEHPGLPRRPARHGDHRGGGGAQRPAHPGQAPGRSEAGQHRRRRRGHACLDLLCTMGLKRENVTVCDIEGVVHEGRPGSTR
jgi:malate dehydrogenase (oxaloacetate-decarboxylating)(NADP+)